MVLSAQMMEVPKLFRFSATAPKSAGRFFAYIELEPAENGHVRVSLRMGSTRKEDLDSRHESQVIPGSIPEEKTGSHRGMLTHEVYV